MFATSIDGKAKFLCRKMEFTAFIRGLIQEGKVSIESTLSPIEPAEFEETKQLLLDFYAEDSLEMPYDVPAFSETKYFYQSTQFTIVRDAGLDAIDETLNPFPSEIRAEEIYSADLVLRHLPELYDLTKGLAPADKLVKNLLDQAICWPFSSVGIKLEGEIKDEVILANASLRQTYIDRIINKKDFSRVNKRSETYLLETAGEYLSTFWPGYEIK
jgi:hypothetical protein